MDALAFVTVTVTVAGRPPRRRPPAEAMASESLHNSDLDDSSPGKADSDGGGCPWEILCGPTRRRQAVWAGGGGPARRPGAAAAAGPAIRIGSRNVQLASKVSGFEGWYSFLRIFKPVSGKAQL